MKKNYLLKNALCVATFLGASSMVAQTVKMSEFKTLYKPVNGTGYDITNVDEQGPGPTYEFGFQYENGAAWGDYNNDGLLDYLTSGTGHGWSRRTFLYKNNGDGTFDYVAGTPFPGLSAAACTWLDYDNDGNLDLFIAGQDNIGKYSGLWRNLGAPDYEFEEVFAGVFEGINNEGGNRNNHYVAAADYDNDGWVDLYLSGQNGANERWSGLYKNLQGTGFELVAKPVKGTNPTLEVADGVQGTWPLIQMNGSAAAWADYNRDGYLDLLANGYWQGTPNLQYDPDVTEDDPDYETKRHQYIPDTGGFVKVLYTNNGDGTFSALVENKKGTDGDVAWADFNNDGLLDYIITQWGNVGWISDVYIQKEDGTFVVEVPTNSIEDGGNGLSGNQESSIAVGDINNDGYVDILHMTNGPNSIYWNNFADGTFTKQAIVYERYNTKDNTPVLHDDGTPNTNIHQWGGTANVVDFDRDGDLDIITAAYGHEPVLARNDLSEDIPVNAPPSVPTNLRVTEDANGVTFSWNASTDDLAKWVGYNLYVAQGDKLYTILPADTVTGRLKVNELIAPLTTTSYTFAGLTGEYTWGVQAIDNAKNASAFATPGGSTAIAPVNPTSVRISSAPKAIELRAAAGLTGTITVYNVQGIQVYSRSGEINGTSVALPTGIYIVKVVSAEGVVTSKTIVR